MKNFISVLSGDLKRALISLKFLLAILGLILLFVIGLYSKQFFSETPVVLYAELLISMLSYNIVFLVFGAIGGTMLFCTDWENKYFRVMLTKTTATKYATSKAITCFLSAFLIVFLSYWLLIGVLSTFCSVYQSWVIGGVYSNLDSEEGAYIYIFIKSLFMSLCAGMLSVFALWLTTKIPNIFVALSTPILTYYVIDIIGDIFNWPSYWEIESLTYGYVNANGNPTVSFTYTVLVFLVFTLLFSIMFVISAKRRFKNG